MKWRQGRDEGREGRRERDVGDWGGGVEGVVEKMHRTEALNTNTKKEKEKKNDSKGNFFYCFLFLFFF